jgi:uncharacterized protein YcbK (DUF882 family)
MALGFSKNYDMSNYEEDQFVELWPEVSEIGIELMEEVIEKSDDSTVFIPGSKDKLIRYLKGCMFILGFSEVDKGVDVDLYDEHTSSAVVRTRMSIRDMGKEISMTDSMDMEFMLAINELFEISNENEIARLSGVLKKNSNESIDDLFTPAKNGAKQQGVNKAETDQNAYEPIDAPKSSVIRGQYIQPGINFPKDASMAEKSIQYSLSKDGNKDLSDNFKVSDFKCRDGSDIVLINPSLISLLEKIREHFGKPVVVVSGYRTPKYNKSISGAANNSQHMYGNAADIKIQGVSPREIYNWMNGWHKGGLGVYPTFTHVDVRDTVGAQKMARWTKDGGGKETLA